MKKLFIISAIAVSGLSINAANAQVTFGLSVGPARVVYTSNPVAVEQTPFYNSDADDYYYLPDVDAYYDVTDQCYVYFDGTEWVSAAYLPGAYRDYDWRNVRRFQVREPRPYLRADFYRSQYNGRRFAEWGHRDRDEHYNAYQDNYHRFDNERNGREQQYQNNKQRVNVWGQGGYNQREQQYKRNDQRSDNMGQGGGYQRSNQNDGRGRDTKGGNEHYVQNYQHRGFDTHKMAKF